MTALARTTLDLPAPLMREIKSRAALAGVSMKDFLTQLLQSALQPSNRASTAKVNVSDAAPDWMAHVGSLQGSTRFTCDPVAILRAMRNEWRQRGSKSAP